MSRLGRIVILVALATASVSTGAAPAAAGAASASASAETSGQPPAISGSLTLASTSDTGKKGNKPSDRPSIASSGQVVAFISASTNLDPGDQDLLNDVYVKDLQTGDLTLATTSDTGVKGNGNSISASLSGDGRTVAFPSTATNLDPGDTDTIHDIYVKDLASGDLTLASTSDAGTKGDEDSFNPSVSKVGAKVAFQSFSTLDPGDTDTAVDIYVKNLATGNTILASTSTAGTKGDASSLFPSISPSGTRVAFRSTADNLDPADTDSLGDIYVKELSTGTLFLASISKAGVKADAPSDQPSLSTTGSKVAFSTEAGNLGPADPNLVSDIYVKDLDTGKVQLASTSDDGVRANGPSFEPALSGNGRVVAFASAATNLDPADTDPGFDIYVKDLVTGDITLATTSSDGVKAPGEPAILPPSISGKGKFAAFESSATNLDGGDTDSSADIYVKQPILCTTIGTAGNDVLTGTSGKDVICGRGGDDTISGGGGADTLFGESGQDVLEGEAGADLLDGGDDTDTLDYVGSTEGVTVDLATGAGQGGDAQSDVFAGIEDVDGSNLDDVLTGDAGDNVLLGRNGDDVLEGAGGADTLKGAGATDVIAYRGSPAAVVVNLTSGSTGGGDASGDTFFQIEGIVGSAFDDTLIGDAGDNVLAGLGGADNLNGEQGTDLADYGDSPSAVSVNLFNGTVKNGDAKGDVLTEIENLQGSAFDDTLTGDDTPNILTGLGGADDLSGKGDDDTLTGGADIDTFDGGGGTDTCDNGAGETATHCEP